MKNKIFFFVLCSIIFSYMFASVKVTATDNSCTLMQAYINNNRLDIVARGDFDLQNADVKVANRQSKITEYGFVSEGNVHVRTTILLDISTSMPYNTRLMVLEFIETIIKELNSYEELRLVTFGDKINIIQDFSSDRYDLDKAADVIKYDGQESKIFDAIYNTIPEISTVDDDPCFYRTIVITDGVDLAAQGITKEELFLRLQSDTYPIDAVCVSKSKPNNENKDLAALTRISNGRYFDIYPESDTFALVSDISVSDYFWVRTEVPVFLLDGSTRQIDVSDGKIEVSFDMKMSVVDAPPVESKVPEVVESKVESTVFKVKSEPSVPVEDSTGSISTTTLIIIIAGVGVAAIAAIIIIALFKKKKQPTDNTNRFTSQNPVTPPNGIDETELISDYGNDEQFAIRISNTANPSESWIINVTSDVIIGRAVGCAIRLDEKSVSREQCKISLRRTGLVLANISGSNPTKLNGTTVSGEMLLHPADNIHFGRITLRVDYIQKIGKESPSPHQDNVRRSGETESIF